MDSNKKLSVKLSKRFSWVSISSKRNTHSSASQNTSSMNSKSTRTLTSSPCDIKHAQTFALQLATSPVVNLNLPDTPGAKAAAPPTRPGLTLSTKGDGSSLSTGSRPAAETPRLSDLPRFVPLAPALSPTSPGGAVRMPPSVVTRHMPLPIQNLPMLPPPPVMEPQRSRASSIRTVRPSIRSVPSLPRVGHDDEREHDDMDPDMDGIDEEEDDTEAAVNPDAGSHDEDPASDASSGFGHAPGANRSSGDISGADRDVRALQNPQLHRRPPHLGGTALLPNKERAGARKGNSEKYPSDSGSLPPWTAGPDDYFAQQPASSSQGRHVPTIVTTAASPGPSATSSHYDSEGPPTLKAPGKHNDIIQTIRPSSDRNPLKLTLPSPGILIASQSLAPASTSTSNDNFFDDPRPSFYRQPSRSMANLLMPTPMFAPTKESTLSANQRKPLPSQAPLKRRTSMPGINPPNYAPPAVQTPGAGFTSYATSALKGHKPSPRDEEGMEHLPPYELTIPIIAALMPRKMEFIKPGEQAEDRKWKRVWCVLEGTSFKVYEGEKGWEKVEGWFGRQVKQTTKPTVNSGKERIKVKGVTPGESEAAQKYVVPPTMANRGHGSASSLHPPEATDRQSISSERSQYASSSRTSMSLSRRSSMSITTPTSSPSQSQMTTSSSSSNCNELHRRALSSAHTAKPNRGHRITSSESSASLGATIGRSHSSRPTSPEPHDCQELPDISYITSRPLIRHYTLQRAESGVAIDYHKRPNVIRVRLEGEQFLLQAKDVREVVEWIEGFQSAADIALDLDERIMPRGPMFPRRRRRRRVTPS